MSKKINNIYFYILSISLIYFLLFAAFYLVCFFDNNGLYKLVIKNETYNYLPFTISSLDLKKICSELMLYLQEKLPFLETNITINGKLVEFYSLRSKIHMADVRNLIIIFKSVSFVSILLCIFSLFKIQKFENSINKIKKTYIKTLIVIGILLLMLIIFASTNFDLFFTKFHETLFDNDLWLLDPNEDFIICLLPIQIFMTYALRIAVAMIIALCLPFPCFQLLSKTQLHQEAK